MRLLLDTHILLWLLEDSPRLKPTARPIILNADEIFVSAATIWEIAIKFRLGKMKEAPELVVKELESAGLRKLDVTYRHAVATAKLPPIHGDPFDRLLVAQAIAEHLQFVTADPKLAVYSDLVTIV